MESRRNKRRPTAPGRIDPPAAKTPSIPPAVSLAHIAAILDGGGQVLIGNIKPVNGVAVAHDGKQTVAMLRRQPNEPVEQLLQRLDSAIAVAKRVGLRVDEINDPSSDVTFLF